MRIVLFLSIAAAGLILTGLAPASAASGSSRNTSSRSSLQMPGRISQKAAKRAAREVKEAQQKLKSAGFYHGPVDAVAGQKTVAAVREYQARNNLKDTGRFDRDTLGKLGVE